MTAPVRELKQNTNHTQDEDTDREATSDSHPRTCPECDYQLEYSNDTDEIVCSDCGLVIQENRIDHGPEWRAFTADERDDRSRVGAPTTHQLHDKGLSTVIGWENKDSQGKTLSGRQRRKMQRLRTWDERFRSKSNQERNLKQALGEISRMTAALDLSDATAETGSVLYRQALEAELLLGRSIEGMATASLYGAARQAGVPRSLDDFTVVSRVDRRRIQRAYRYLVSELGLEIAPADPARYVPRFVSELELSNEAERKACELLEAAKRQNAHSGKSPVALAAGAVYAAAILVNESVTQHAVADVANVAAVTVRNRYQELIELYSM